MAKLYNILADLLNNDKISRPGICRMRSINKRLFPIDYLKYAAILIMTITTLSISGCADSSTCARPSSTPDPAIMPQSSATPASPSPAASLYVDPIKGSDNSPGTQSAPLKTIQKAMDKARPGIFIILADGNYMQDIVTRKGGDLSQPITIKGSSSAVIKGGGSSHIFEINHSFITLDGFTIDGLFGNPEKASGYREKLIYAAGKEIGKGITGLRILNMTLRNSGGEAIRLRYFASSNEIAFNTITNCGVCDYKFGGGADNGEGIYVGTSAKQINDGRNPSNDIDHSNDNWIHHNTIDTQGSECVDIKEGSSGNIVEYNTCTGQKNPNTGGLQSRGTFNVFRYNTVYGNAGAGIRLGSDVPGEGINNDVYCNTIHDNRSGGIKFASQPQGKICSNIFSNNNEGDSTGEYGHLFSPSDDCNG